MKKTLAIMLALVMAASLAACSSSDSSADAEEETVEAEEAEETEEEEDEAPEGDEEEEEGEAPEGEGEAVEEDLAYIQEKGTLVVGITDFEPMDYKDEEGNWIGFDADMANAFAESLGVEAEFVEIDWDNKELELDGRTIDCVWNGMTLTDEVLSAMSCSNAYSSNSQVIVLSTASDESYQEDIWEAMDSMTFAVEAGSAGEAAAEDYGLNTTAVGSQADALMEVEAGTSDAAIIDLLMAEAMTGEGTSYEDLEMSVTLVDEEYGVGFRRGSDLVDLLNSFFAESYSDGTMTEIAETYGIEGSIIAQ